MYTSNFKNTQIGSQVGKFYSNQVLANRRSSASTHTSSIKPKIYLN